MAAIEFRDIAAGVYATDALLKKAPIAFLKSGTVTEGRFLTLLGGSTASVDEALREAVFRAGSAVLDHVFLPDVHPGLHDGILGRRTGGEGSLVVVETGTVSAAIQAAERALKGTPVTLVEIRLADQGLAGKGLVILRGELHDIEAALDLILDVLKERGRAPLWRILPAPHEALSQQLAAGTSFSQCAPLELDGEVV